MSGTITLTAAHWVYLLGVIAITITMIVRANVVVPAILATFLTALVYSGSVITGVTSVFNASFVAAKELFNIFLVIAFMTSLLNSLKALGSDVMMVEPFRKVMGGGLSAYIILSVITYFLSLFFWPTPAVPLVGAILIPAAIAAGLPAMGAAVAVAIAGQGMALSSDYVIRVGPGISAKAAGIDMVLVADKVLVLSLITGIVALILGYLAIRKNIRPPNPAHLEAWEAGATLQSGAGSPGTFKKEALAEATSHTARPTSTSGAASFFAIAAPLVFLAIVLAMVAPKFISGMPDLKGGDGAALIGGAAAVLLIFAVMAKSGFVGSLNATADHVVDGLIFAFKAMGSVLPIAGFFFLGAQDLAGPILGIGGGAKGPNFLFDLVQAGQGLIPQNHFLVAFGVLIVGAITGIDGSGFSGLPLTGALSGALGPTVGMDTAALAAIGQMGAVWTGGGTLIAWSSLIAVTGFARVNVLDAVRVLFVPVVAGLIVSTIVAVIIW